MLEELAGSISTNKNILEKQEIVPIIKFIESNAFKSKRIVSDIGEDAASIRTTEEIYTLMTTDRIKTQFIKDFPYGAGFSSILVGVDDIYACGGMPIAASVITSFRDKRIGQKLIEGICEGSKKFQVPIIRGHTKVNGNYELSSTILGEIKSTDYISAKNAQYRDDIILAVDFEGIIAKANKFYWDTTTVKSSEIVLNKRHSMNKIAKKHLCHASKDISNAGLFGTLIQLAEFSKVGVRIDVENIILPPKLIEAHYTLIDYTKMYLTTSFILSVPKSATKSIIEIFNNHSMHANVIGEIIQESSLIIKDSEKEIVVLDLMSI